MLRLAILAALLSLTACQGTPPTRPATPVAAAATGMGELRGEILLPPGAPVPDSGRLELALVERFSAEPATLARRELTLEGPPPYRISLPFPREAVGDISVYRLEVALYDADGRLLYASDGEHPVNLGVEAEPTRVALIAIDTTPGPAHGLDCGGFVAELRFADPDLELVENGNLHRLRRAQAARGRRYVGADAELWMDADEARLQLGPRGEGCVPLR